MAKNTFLQNAKYNHTKNVTEVKHHAIYLNALVNFFWYSLLFSGGQIGQKSPKLSSDTRL